MAQTIEERRAYKREYQKKWRAAHPDYHMKVWAAKYYGPHNPRYLAYARACALKSKYGITLEQYDAMLVAQNGVCALCFRPPSKYRLAVDHNHTTGQVRKLLCNGCNTKLFAIEDVEFRTKAEAYIASFEQG